MSEILDKTKLFVKEILNENLPATFLYHNLKHTLRVVKSVEELIPHSTLTEEDIEALLLAAWLHDIGYAKGCENHEATSIEMAKTFLESLGATQVLIKKVNACIEATKMDAKPNTEIEKILRDADASHFAKPYFKEASELLRLELNLHRDTPIEPLEWLETTLNLLEHTHVFYTTYAHNNWTPIKNEHIDLLKAERKKLKKEAQKQIKLQKQAYRNNDPEKAIQSVYRVTLRNHLKLSDIADTKANILLSVNAIIISIALSNLLPKLDNPSNQYLVVPTVVFLLFTVASIILSVLATRPNITSGKFTKEDVQAKKVNLLFFGNFHKMKLESFEWAMDEMLQDKTYIYHSLSKDLYFLGLVLHKKYRILRVTYTIFMIGIICSVLAFAIAFKAAGN